MAFLCSKCREGVTEVSTLNWESLPMLSPHQAQGIWRGGRNHVCWGWWGELWNDVFWTWHRCTPWTHTAVATVPYPYKVEPAKILTWTKNLLSRLWAILGSSWQENWEVRFWKEDMKLVRGCKGIWGMSMRGQCRHTQCVYPWPSQDERCF